MLDLTVFCFVLLKTNAFFFIFDIHVLMFEVEQKHYVIEFMLCHCFH